MELHDQSFSLLVHRLRRQTQADRALDRVPPTASESQELHSMYLNYGQEDKASNLNEEVERVWMGDTRLEKTMVMFPQERKCVFQLSMVHHASHTHIPIACIKRSLVATSCASCTSLGLPTRACSPAGTSPLFPSTASRLLVLFLLAPSSVSRLMSYTHLHRRTTLRLWYVPSSQYSRRRNGV